MVTMDNLEQITRKLSLEIGIPNDELMEDISSIVYYVDVFECDRDTSIVERHIDIEYSFGEYCEIPEGSELFQFICSLYGLPLLQEEKEITIYQKDEE